MCGFWRSRREERGGREGRGREEDGGGEGGYCVLDILDGHWASIRRTGSVMTLEGDLCSSWSHLVQDVASKMYVFQLENSMVHEIRTLMLEGPNFVKFFLFLILKTSLFPRKNDRVLKNEN